MEDADNATIDAILALQLQDLAEVRSNQDGNDRDQTDVEIAIGLYRQELEEFAVRIHDRDIGIILGRSDNDDIELPAPISSSTPQFDQLHSQSSADDPLVGLPSDPQLNTLAITAPDEVENLGQDPTAQGPTGRGLIEVQSDTTTETTDDQTLDEPCRLTERSLSHDSLPYEECSDMISAYKTTTIDLTENVTRPLGHSTNEIEKIDGLNDGNLGQKSGETATGENCLACGDYLSPTEQLHVPCGDSYCHECVKHLFESAMKDDSLFPPQCCGEHIPLNLVEDLFEPRFTAMFGEREIELGTSHRTYCADPSCSTFIKADNIKDGTARCPVCFLETCAICKGIAHDHDCPEDPAVKSLMEVARVEGYKQCHACKVMVELTFGCNHMRYVCIDI
ncbi:MAG: hypothetical protein Q9196_006637 [Gyalolechia fulgens]